MALYVSNAKRARRTVITAVTAAVAAFVVGLVIGRQQVPSISERVRSVQRAAGDVAIGLERLDIEYEQTLKKSGQDTVQAGVLTPLNGLRTELQRTFDRAPWLTSTQRAVGLDALAQVESDATKGVPLATFQSSANAAGAVVRTLFGIKN